MSRVLVPIFLLMAACGGGDEEDPVLVVPTSPLAPPEEIADDFEPPGPPERTTFRDEETGSLSPRDDVTVVAMEVMGNGTDGGVVGGSVEVSTTDA